MENNKKRYHVQYDSKSNDDDFLFINYELQDEINKILELKINWSELIDNPMFIKMPKLYRSNLDGLKKEFSDRINELMKKQDKFISLLNFDTKTLNEHIVYTQYIDEFDERKEKGIQYSKILYNVIDLFKYIKLKMDQNNIIKNYYKIIIYTHILDLHNYLCCVSELNNFRHTLNFSRSLYPSLTKLEDIILLITSKINCFSVQTCNLSK